MPATPSQDSDVCFSDFIDESAYQSGADSGDTVPTPAVSASTATASSDSRQEGGRAAEALVASTPSASTASTGSPRASDLDAPSPFGATESALTSAPTSPPAASTKDSSPNASGIYSTSMDPHAPRQEGLEQFAAAWQAHQQALAFHTDQAAALQAAAIAASASGHPFVMPSVSGPSQPTSPYTPTFPQAPYPPNLSAPQPPAFHGAQLPQEWIQAANLAQGYSGTTTPVTVPGFPQLAPPGMQANQTPLPLQSLHQLGQSTSHVADPSLYALHASLDMQARLAAYASAGSLSAGQNAATDFLAAQTHLLGQSAGPSAPASPATAGTPHFRSPSGPRSATTLRHVGKGAGGSQANSRVRSARSSQQGSPLASPAITPGSQEISSGAASPQPAYAPVAGPSTTHQRPLPAMPPARIDTSVSLAPGSAALSPGALAHFTNMPARPSALGLSSATTSAMSSRQQSPQPSFVDYDFSSLEQDLDRFSSAGGFASAAAAAIASVSPTSSQPPLPSLSTAMPAGQDPRAGSSSRPHDAYGVGGYGGAPTPRLDAGALPSPRVLTDVLGETVYFPPPGSAKGSSPAQSASAGNGSVVHSPAAGAGSIGSSAAYKGTGVPGSPAADSSSPAGSTILDEESAEALSRKDPIAAQVWRMFHKAKNTMPNGARMENLTWRLMSMTLKKRKEDGGGSVSPMGGSASSSLQPTPAPQAIPTFAELAQQRSTAAAIPTNVSAPSSNAPSPGTEARRAEEEEGRDTVQPLESVGAPAGRMRAARERERERLSSLDSRYRERDVQQTVDHEEEERGRRRRSRGDNLSKSASATPESDEPSEDIMDWRALSKSRSRSRAPDMMDWRGQSRSRSRAPDFRVSAAPPAVDSTNAVANFSRFFNDASLPSPILEQDGSPLGSQLPEPDASDLTAVVTDLPSAQDANAAALAELATSLGLSPQDQANLFGSAAARFDSAGISSFPSPSSLPATAHQSAVTSPAAAVTPQAFAFPSTAPSPDGSGPDPNLAAIETTLNQLISLHHLSTPSPTAGLDVEHAEKQATSPKSAAMPLEPTPASRERSPSVSSSLSSAQQHLQQFISGRKASSGSVKGASASSSRRVSASTSSSYVNATTLAQGARSFSFGAAANAAAAAAASTSPSASGISLARPQHVQPQTSLPTSPYADAGLPAFLSGSAPTSALFGSPEGSLYGSHSEAAPSMYDYFNSAYQPAPHLSAAHLDTYGSAPAGVDPSQLLARSAAPSSLSSEPSSWGISAHSLDSSATGAMSPLDEEGHKKPLPKLRRPSGARSASASSLPTLANKVKTQTASRPHSRSNTISLPSTIKEGQTFDGPIASTSAEPDSILVNSAETSPAGDEGDDASAGDSSKLSLKKMAANGEPLRCINCQTENTPLWRRGADGNPLCNACGLFRNLHGVDRPAKLNTGVIKKRNRTRGPKDPTKKTNRVRRNSVAGGETTPSASSARKDRAGAGAPYPSAAARAAQLEKQAQDDLA